MSDVNHYVEFGPLSLEGIQAKCNVASVAVGEFYPEHADQIREVGELDECRLHECLRSPVFHRRSMRHASAVTKNLFHHDHHQYGTVGWLFVWANLKPTQIQPPQGLAIHTLPTGVLVAFSNTEWKHRQQPLTEEDIDSRYFYRLTVTRDLTPEQVTNIGNYLTTTFGA